MGHHINYNENTGKHSVFVVKEPAWHGLGQVVPERVTSREAIKLGGLDFEVGKMPAEINMPGFGVKEIPNKFGTYRMDLGIPFNTVGSRYEIVQNRDAFEFFDAITGKEEAMYETAGCLFDGQVVFITAKLPSYIRVGKDDLIEKFIFLKSTHDGSGSIVAGFTPTRILCWNTLNIALSNMTNKVSIRHTKDAKMKLEQAHLIMGISNKLSDELSEIFNAMARKTIVDADLRKYIETLMLPPVKELVEGDEQKKEEISTRAKNKVKTIYEYALSAPSQQNDTTRGTLYGCFNSITGYYQNVKNYRTPSHKLEDIIGGNAEIMTQKAFDLALTML